MAYSQQVRMNSEGRDLIIHIRSFYRIDAKVETRQGRAIVFVTKP